MTGFIFIPRGVHNNNPGNIRLSVARWRGQRPVQADPEFVEFETPAQGLRALMVLLLTYYRKYGLDTVDCIINRYAPPHENATDHYAFSVARQMGVKRQQRLHLVDPETIIALARAIVRHECGPAPKERRGMVWQRLLQTSGEGRTWKGMNMKNIIGYLVNRAKERSTWLGLISLVSPPSDLRLMRHNKMP